MSRLFPATRDSKSLVFDGGYVFGSVFRSAFEHGVPSVWVRRGMWQAGQDNTIALDREKSFTRVIVPTEAFDELNSVYSHGDRVRDVGPIVQVSKQSAKQKKALRASLQRRFGFEFDTLAVTMLGGGVAADRSAQVAALSAMFEARPRTLHLVIVWPTATVESSAFGWRNTRIVKTHHAHGIVKAADVFISAVGYNSFHEAMYNAIPTIFMPQMAAFMDDQHARARAAVERDLAVMVEPHQFLTLEAEIDAFIGGKAIEIRNKLIAETLPDPGNKDAARMIEEICR